MADYVAVAEAMRIASKQTSLLREVMKMRAEGAASSSPKDTGASSGETKANSSKK
jgi:hypothetical protein